jgi:hypothetical protein
MQFRSPVDISSTPLKGHEVRTAMANSSISEVTYAGGGMRRVGDPPRKPGRCELCRQLEAPLGDHLCVGCRGRLTEAFLVYLDAVEERRERVEVEVTVHVGDPERRRGRMYSRAG